MNINYAPQQQQPKYYSANSAIVNFPRIPYTYLSFMEIHDENSSLVAITG